VREATRLVGNTLVDEANKNRQFRNFLENCEYIIIDNKGRIAATNKKMFLGIGRIRLDTRKILEGQY